MMAQACPSSTARLYAVARHAGLELRAQALNRLQRSTLGQRKIVGGSLMHPAPSKRFDRFSPEEAGTLRALRTTTAFPEAAAYTSPVIVGPPLSTEHHLWNPETPSCR